MSAIFITATGTDIGDMHVVQNLQPFRGVDRLIPEQASDHIADKAALLFSRAVQKKRAAPGEGDAKIFRLHLNLLSGCIFRLTVWRGRTERRRCFVEKGNGPVVFSAGSRSHKALSAIGGESLEQSDGGVQPRAIFRAVPKQPGFGNPGQMQEMARPQPLQQRSGRFLVHQVELMDRLGTPCSGVPAADHMHLKPQRLKRADTVRADKAVPSGDQDTRHESSGSDASRADITATSSGHRMPIEGSFQRTPVDASMTYSVSI